MVSNQKHNKRSYWIVALTIILTALVLSGCGSNGCAECAAARAEASPARVSMLVCVSDIPEPNISSDEAECKPVSIRYELVDN